LTLSALITVALAAD